MITEPLQLWLEENGFGVDDLRITREGKVAIRVDGNFLDTGQPVMQTIQLDSRFQVEDNKEFVRNRSINIK